MTRPEATIREIVHNLISSPMFTVSAMPNSAWEILPDLRVPELHDRMIAAEALSRKVAIVTSDEMLRGVGGLRTFW